MLLMYRENLAKYTKDKNIEFIKIYAKDRSSTCDLSDYPEFRYAELSFNERIKNIFIDILILVVLSIIFFMGAYLSFLRYDVR